MQYVSKRARAALMIAAMTVVSGCSLVPDYERPALDTPASWSAAPDTSASAQPVTADWWRRFQSAELDALMSETLAANQDLAAAIARIEQARASLRVARAPLFPFVDASASVSRTRTDNMMGVSFSNASDIGGDAGYELDLFGRNRAGVESAEASLASSAYDKEALALVLQSDVATTYFEVLALKERLAIARENLDAAREVLRLVETQMNLGSGTALDSAQQRAAVASFESQIPQLEQQIQAAQSALDILRGRAPGRTQVAETSLEALALPAIVAGQPSELLQRRPDIRRSESDLLGANADIGAARAAFFPTLNLSASAAIDALATGGASSVASVAASLVAPIFSGGQLEGELDRTKARREELVAAYRQTVLTSFKEVEDAMTVVTTSADRAALLDRAAAEAREAFRLAQLSYQAGASDFLTVLDAQRTLLDAEDSLVQAELDRYTSAATLFKALGGGWNSLLDVASM